MDKKLGVDIGRKARRTKRKTISIGVELLEDIEEAAEYAGIDVSSYICTLLSEAMVRNSNEVKAKR